MNADEAYAEQLRALKDKAETFSVELRALCERYDLRLLIVTAGAADLYVSDPSGLLELKALTEPKSVLDDDFWEPRTFPRMRP